MRSPPRRRFVPRTIFETALVAVVPSITAIACRRPLTVANRGFGQQTVAAQFVAPTEAEDAGSASESSDVIDAAAVAEDSGATAEVVAPNHDDGPARGVAYQGFTNNSPVNPAADAGTRPRSRRR